MITCKLDANLACHYEIERNWASVKLKSQQLFIQTIRRRTVKFNYRKVFVPYIRYDTHYSGHQY